MNFLGVINQGPNSNFWFGGEQIQSKSDLMLVGHCIDDLELEFWKVKQRDAQVPGGYDFQKQKIMHLGFTYMHVCNAVKIVEPSEYF
jgi:hypothetical protein